MVPLPFLTGGDVSEIPEVEAGGASYFLDGKKQAPFALMKKAGWNWVRFRIWNAPRDGFCDKGQTLALAKRAAAQGLRISLDFHYSDWWADPGKQTKPAAWKDLSFAELNKAVYNYTYEVVAAMIEQGTPPVMVQVGNEVIGGMLWPEGRVRSNEEETWQRFATLLKSGLRAVRDAEKLLPGNGESGENSEGGESGENGKRGENGEYHSTSLTTPSTEHRAPKTENRPPPQSRILTLLHIDRGGDNAASVWWMDHILKQGVEFDALGQSFYPWWHGTLEDLQKNLNDLATRYGKDIYVVETAYPWTMDHKRRSLFNEKEKLLPGYPATPEGQVAFLNKVTEIIKAVPGGHGKGLLYWAPTWITGPKNNAPYPYENLATFDPEGNALPAVKALGVRG